MLGSMKYKDIRPEEFPGTIQHHHNPTLSNRRQHRFPTPPPQWFPLHTPLQKKNQYPASLPQLQPASAPSRLSPTTAQHHCCAGKLHIQPWL
ncbi:predicted protein [Plenodomus lingam JN3]|uniref:Predicted protein n=1 Tax=Leptosphaeria maculans (strain JN3 / isolate v23.1.3 / race Av1-4-5-6-7-8) TaxID=985895 RepID=E5A9P1_LEPMJ|nr:predicted protein [Plenodomus lingam JN3]CBY00382.1 predicted protein [Plenodomus lingam JN3]